jgi:hypothetical protein
VYFFGAQIYAIRLATAVAKAIIAAGKGTKILLEIESRSTKVPATYRHKIINEISTFISQMRRYQNGDIDLLGVMPAP